MNVGFNFGAMGWIEIVLEMDVCWGNEGVGEVVRVREDWRAKRSSQGGEWGGFWASAQDNRAPAIMSNTRIGGRMASILYHDVGKD